jgi:hypothetical protein
MTISVSKMKDELADREVIRDCLFRYSRAVDRRDEDLLRSVYWPDATDTHLAFTGSAEGFIQWALPKLRAMNQTMHLIGNIIIRLSGFRADVESYVYGFHRIETGGVMRDTIACGRYLDRFERRGDEWRIAARLLVTDWFREYPDSADWTAGPFGMGEVDSGSSIPHDRSYTWLNLR